MTKTSEQFKKAYQKIEAPEGLRRSILMEISEQEKAPTRVWFTARAALPVGALVILLAIFIGLGTEQDDTTSLVALDNEVKIFEESVPETTTEEVLAFAVSIDEKVVDPVEPEVSALMSAGLAPAESTLAEPAEPVLIEPETEELPQGNTVGGYFDEEFGSARYDLILSDL